MMVLFSIFYALVSLGDRIYYVKCLKAAHCSFIPTYDLHFD